MSQYETTTLTPGERQTKLTTEESNDNIDPNSPSYQGNQKKPSIFGKLKDRTKKAGSKIKAKVGKKKNADGEDDEDDEEDISEDSPLPSPADHAASPAVQTTPYKGPTSVPREFGTYPSQGKSKDSEFTPPDVSGLSLNDSSTTPGDRKYEQRPSATDEANRASEGAKDTIYGGAAATAGVLGYDAMSKDDRRDERPVTEKTSDASSDAAGKAEELGRGGYNRAGEAKDTVAEEGSRVTDQTKDAAYEMKDAAQSKAADLNNATDDSQTYTDKARNTAVAAKDTVVETFGMNQPSEGPSVVDKAKDYFGSAADTTRERTGALGYDRRNDRSVTEKASDASSDAAGKAEELGRGGYNRAGEAKDTVAEKGSRVADQTKDAAYETKDAAQAKAADLNNATDDSQTYTDKARNTAVAAKDTVAETLGLNQPSEGPSMVDKAKDYFGSAADTTKDKTGTGVDTAKDYAGSAYDNTARAAQGATDTTKEYATRARDTVADAATPKDEHKDLSAKITESLGGLTAPANTPTSGAARDEASPGILGKLTGMLGYPPQKGPENQTLDSGAHPATTNITSTTAANQ